MGILLEFSNIFPSLSLITSIILADIFIIARVSMLPTMLEWQQCTFHLVFLQCSLQLAFFSILPKQMERAQQQRSWVTPSEHSIVLSISAVVDLKLTSDLM